MISNDNPNYKERWNKISHIVLRLIVTFAMLRHSTRKTAKTARLNGLPESYADIEINDPRNLEEAKIPGEDSPR